MVGNAVDCMLRDSFATVLTYLEQKSDADMNTSTFSNRNSGDGIAIEECMNVLFPRGHEKDNFLLFEVSVHGMFTPALWTHANCKTFLLRHLTRNTTFDKP
jgi:hypothetical protein